MGKIKPLFISVSHTRTGCRTSSYLAYYKVSARLMLLLMEVSAVAVWEETNVWRKIVIYTHMHTQASTYTHKHTVRGKRNKDFSGAQLFFEDLNPVIKH